MIGKQLSDLDTPSLIINLNQMEANLKYMQDFANLNNVNLRPHIKTHKSSELAHLQEEYGAKGITVATVSEAEVMAESGIDDIFIATEIVGDQKLKRIGSIAEKANIRLAVDSIEHIKQLTQFFGTEVPVKVMIEVDTGMNRCGVMPADALNLAREIAERFPTVKLAGIFTHEGQPYNADSKEEVRRMAMESQIAVIKIGKEIKTDLGINCDISIGCTLTQLSGVILPGITEVRPGTYVFYDNSHADYLGDTKYCAATILTTITSKKDENQVVADAGAKSMTIDKRSSGIIKVRGFGQVKGHPHMLIERLSDEHAVIVSEENDLAIGDRIELIPNHICPTVNLYNQAYGIRNGVIEQVIRISARGCVQ